MSVDVPLAEPGRTRRSSRSLPAPVSAPSEQPDESRPQFRRRTTDAASTRPAVVWGRVTTMDAAASPVADAAEAPTIAAPAEARAMLSRRARRIIATPTVAITVIETELTEETLTAVETDPADEFEAAARLFAFTGETSIIRPEEPVMSAPPTAADATHTARRGRRKVGASFKRAAAASFSIGVMSVVGLLAVGMTTPTQAVAAATGTENVETAQYEQLAGDVQGSNEIQAYVAPSQIQNTQIDRPENYQTARLVDLAGSAGISNFSSSVFTNNPNCPIQWPFAVGVSMSYGFGMRDGTMHEGVDFTPGDGAHIQAIDDGVVRISTDSGGAFGVTIVIDHVVDGQLVSSRYGHMQYGSRQVEVGDHVEVGEYIGRTGDTGRSFGAHTHVEILAGGTTAIDPLPWFQQHATC